MMDSRANFFDARAEGNIDTDPTIDVWVIKEDGKPLNIVDDAVK